jgi:hypothetical protein
VPRATDDTYDDIPYEDLLIEPVDCERYGEYIRTRSFRKAPRSSTFTPNGPRRRPAIQGPLVEPGRSRSGQTIRVIGWSEWAGRLLTVLLMGVDEPVAGEWEGINAWAANDDDQREYARLNDGED